MNYIYTDSPIGVLTIGENDGKIVNILFGKAEMQGENAENALLNEAATQLREYFDGKRERFNLPLSPVGTAFQKRVWQALLTVPYGKTASYKDMAILAGSPLGYRAVGMANNKNPISIVIP